MTISVRCPYGARPAPFRFCGRRHNFKNPYGRRCVEDAAPNSPGVLFKPVARKQPVKDPAGCTRGPPGDRPANGRAPRDSFSPILVNRYNGHRTVSKGAGRLPFGTRADPWKVPGVMLITGRLPYGVRPMYKLPARTPNGNIESIIFLIETWNHKDFVKRLVFSRRTLNAHSALRQKFNMWRILSCDPCSY